ncbi:MAG: polymer-forming cytoskeletal protein [Candidatus Adiutrix sp.]|jgi:cytoskeletal protein CcmA (bactofilin family)|nr:polymer-forming cytoskeletal protein [Candidatus Adiutrix sp.]
MFNKKKKNPGYSYFSSDVTLEGRLCFTGSVRIDGRVNGEIISTGLLVVEATAIITGDILVENIILSGTVYGNIQASKQVQLHSTAKVYGHINYGELSIEGALHEGSSHKLSAEEIAIVQTECAELMEEAAARAEQFVPDISDFDRYALKPGSQKRIGAQQSKTVQALPESESAKAEQARAQERQARNTSAKASRAAETSDAPEASKAPEMAPPQDKAVGAL